MSIPLDLHAIVRTASGTRYRWDANQPPGSRLTNLSFSTKTGEGFSSAQGQLARRIDNDYPDLNLVDTVTFIGADGSVAWEGRVSALPRELTDKHSIGVTLTGWMAHAKDRKFSEIYVDRSISGWQGISRQRSGVLLTANYQPTDGTQTIDPTVSQAGATTSFQGAWASGFQPVSELWYDAGAGLKIRKIAYTWARQSTNVGTVAPWTWLIGVFDDDAGTTGVNTGNLAGAGPTTSTYTPVTPNRFVMLQFYVATSPAGADGLVYSIWWYNLALYGDHGLSTYLGEAGQPEGVVASDVIKNIAKRWCPQLDTSGVETTSLVIQHLEFRDRAFPYDAFEQINKYHLWQLAVWEDEGDGPRLVFEPYDLTDHDWEIRTDEQGTTFSPQGPAIDSMFNGVAVTYTDALKGTRHVLTPDTQPSLAISDPENPWNKHGVPHWDEIVLSTPSTEAQALQLGRAALADRNSQKTPGTVTVQGYIRDRQGNDQPGWKVRAGDTISVTNFPNDSPRLIVETSWDAERKELSMSIDRPFALLEAYIDRANTALSAKGLGG